MKVKSFINRAILLVLIIFAGFIFYLGWEQLEMNENTYGVIFTKTSGWKNKTINTEGFNWSFEKVIPGNYTMHKFTINNNYLNFTENDILPSGKLYAEFNNLKSDNFSYNYSLTGSFKLNTAYLIPMIKNGSFTEATFENWQQNITDEIENLLRSFIREKLASSETLTLNGAANNYLSELYPYLEISDIYINLTEPDMLLYNLSRNRYIHNMEAQVVADEKYLAQSLEQKNRETLRLDLLKKYGEIFTKYPIMIEYLKIDQHMTLDRATMEDFIAP